MFDNLADAPDELSFRKGDVITVLEQDVDGLIGWWLCSLHGRQGIAPGNRLQQIKTRLDGQTSPETSSAVFTFEDVDYDVPRAQEGVEDYAVPRGIRSPDYDVPNTCSSPAEGYQYLGDPSDNARLDSHTVSDEVYDVPTALLDDNFSQEIYDIPPTEQDGVESIEPALSAIPCQGMLGEQIESTQLTGVPGEPDIYSEIYDVPLVSGDEDIKKENFERVPKPDDVPQEKRNSAELHKARKPLSSHCNGKRQSSSSTDSTKVSSDDDDYVDYQDIYGDGREKDVSVYDVPVQVRDFLSLDQVNPI